MGGQRQVMGGHWEVVEGQWEAIAIKCTSPTAMSISRSEILKGEKQEHKVSYRCSLPSPLQKRSKDYKGLGGSSIFELLSCFRLWQEVSEKLLSEKLLAKVVENSEPQNLQKLPILCNPWISSAMAMAMSIYSTLSN